MAFKVDPDYVDVAERIREFKTTYPDGTLQPVDHDNPYIVQEIGGETVIVYHAAAFRTPDDPRPGIGVASEPYPGKTPYTKGSEIQNAETSAWGRAIVALGIPTKRVASSEEVRNREAERSTQQDQQREQAAAVQQAAPATAPAPAGNGTITQAQAKQLHENLVAKGRGSKWFLGVIASKGIGDGEHLTSIPSGEYDRLLEIVAGFTDPPPPEPPSPAAAPAPTVSADDFAEPAQVAQEPHQEVAAPAAASAAPESSATAGAAPADEGEEVPPGMDAEQYKAYLEEQRIAAAGQTKRKATVTPQQLTRLGAQCAELENLGVGEQEWRTYMETEEGVRSRKLLTKTAAVRMIDRLRRWNVDLQTGVVGASEKAVA